MFKKKIIVKVNPYDKTIQIKRGRFGSWVVYSGGYYDSVAECVADFKNICRGRVK